MDADGEEIDGPMRAVGGRDVDELMALGEAELRPVLEVVLHHRGNGFDGTILPPPTNADGGAHGKVVLLHIKAMGGHYRKKLKGEHHNIY